MIENQLKTFLERKKCTLLGVGPMSMNCVDATIEIANEYDVPTFLIASRRQIDSENFGGGYVNNWSTKEFSEYVLDKDKKGRILMARDHGGPWQNSKEIEDNLNLEQAMESAKESYSNDIESGFKVIHIDPSIDIHSTPNVDEVLERIFELYDFCWEKASSLGKEIIFEIGTEEQSGSTNTQEELDYTLNKVQDFCRQNKLPKPTFVVIQCGTRVMETRNVGSFDSPIRVSGELPPEIQLPRMLEICKQYNIFMKEHNTDYVSDEALKWHPRLGIHAANVAPEFGVIETRSLIEILEKYKFTSLSERFLQISYDSMKWEKWMMPNSQASDKEKSIIAGHYVFSDPECIELKKEAEKNLKKHQVNLNEFLKLSVKRGILRYFENFRLLRAV